MAGVGPSKVGDQVRFSSQQLHGHPRQTPPSRQLLQSRSGDDLRSNSGRIALTAVKAKAEHCEDDRAEADQKGEMPHFGQAPGLSLSTPRHIGQKQFAPAEGVAACS